MGQGAIHEGSVGGHIARDACPHVQMFRKAPADGVSLLRGPALRHVDTPVLLLLRKVPISSRKQNIAFNNAWVFSNALKQTVGVLNTTTCLHLTIVASKALNMHA